MAKLNAFRPIFHASWFVIPAVGMTGRREAATSRAGILLLLNVLADHVAQNRNTLCN